MPDLESILIQISTSMRNDKRPSLSNSITTEVIRFIEYHPAKRFERNLRKLIIEFLQCQGAPETPYLNDLLYDLEGLFVLLDAIQDDGEEKK